MFLLCGIDSLHTLVLPFMTTRMLLDRGMTLLVGFRIASQVYSEDPANGSMSVELQVRNMSPVRVAPQQLYQGGPSTQSEAVTPHGYIVNPSYIDLNRVVRPRRIQDPGIQQEPSAKPCPCITATPKKPG